jgi:cell division protein DivIC
MAFNGKYRIKKRFFVLFLIIGYVGISFGQQFYKINSIDKEINSYLQTKKALAQEQEKLQDEIKLLENKSYIERIAREDLGLIKPGETLLVPGEEGDIRKAKSLEALQNNIH